MQLKVSELSDHLAKRNEASATATMANFEVTDDATTLTVTNGSTSQYSLDETATSALGKYLGIPVGYLNKVGPEQRANMLRYELDRHKDASTTVESLNGDIIAVHQPSQTMLPLDRVAEVITTVLKPEDTIRRVIINEERFHLDATTNEHQVKFPANPTALSTTTDPATGQAQVYDITEAGLRFLSYPFQVKSPAVMTYTHRLICMNGATTEEKLGRINLKGRNPDEVAANLEEAANLLISELDEYLERLSATREMMVPGSPQAFAAQLAREAHLKAEVLNEVLDIINQLPEPVSVWDVQQAFTTVANGVDRYTVMTRMQTLGGYLAFQGEAAIARCNTCERVL